MKDFDDGVRCRDPRVSFDASVTSSSAKCAEVKKMPVKAVDKSASEQQENLPDVPGRSRRSRKRHR